MLWPLECCTLLHSRAPRFLLKQNTQSTLERNYEYLQQRELQRPTEVYPNPTTVSLLPLRPKSCMPRMKNATEPKAVQISGMFDTPTQVMGRKIKMIFIFTLKHQISHNILSAILNNDIWTKCGIFTRTLSVVAGLVVVIIPSIITTYITTYNNTHNPDR